MDYVVLLYDIYGTGWRAQGSGPDADEDNHENKQQVARTATNQKQQAVHLVFQRKIRLSLLFFSLLKLTKAYKSQAKIVL